ncbi:MAG TPA: aminotransferase class I/II-fold pyridoxal phosphate-dependent enzyme [Anaerohalosphaeraceae bacterium]|nr:aminotransferase class I/II-fold pyridoxal phosphate-dependent enzyme [Anaerohalosphaeraceae bacterium]
MDEFVIEPSSRIKRLPPYLFGRLNALKLEKRRQDIDIIDLGMGNPMDGAPDLVIDKLCEAARDPRNHRYSASKGIFNLRREMALKYERKWNVSLDPETEVLACIGSKEGFSHMCLAMLGPGDTAVVADPAFPIHIYGVALAGANVITVPLGNDQKFLDTIAMVCEHLFPRPKLLILNYPHNPTGMTVEEGFFETVVDLAKRFQIAVIHDFAYGETCFDGYKAPSFLSAKGAKDVGVEFTTLSKPYGMAGFRIGFAAGNRKMIEALATIKGYYDYGIFQPIQIASIIAMRHCDDHIRIQNEKYQARRDIICEGLKRIGWEVDVPRASMFVWTKFPVEHSKGKGSIDFAMELLENAYVAMAPGRAFGENGEYHMRIALVENEHRLRQAVRNIGRYLQGKPVPGKRRKQMQIP